MTIVEHWKRDPQCHESRRRSTVLVLRALSIKVCRKDIVFAVIAANANRPHSRPIAMTVVYTVLLIILTHGLPPKLSAKTFGERVHRVAMGARISIISTCRTQAQLPVAAMALSGMGAPSA